MPYWQYWCNSGHADTLRSVNDNPQAVRLSERGSEQSFTKASKTHIFNGLWTHYQSCYMHPLVSFWPALSSPRLVPIPQSSKLWCRGSGFAFSSIRSSLSGLFFSTKAPIIPHSLSRSGSYILAHSRSPSEFSGGSRHSTVSARRHGTTSAA